MFDVLNKGAVGAYSAVDFVAAMCIMFAAAASQDDSSDSALAGSGILNHKVGPHLQPDQVLLLSSIAAL